MLQTVAVMGPARISAPLTQAITAPMMGRLQARGVRPRTEFAACLALRLVHYAVMLAIFIYVILGGLDAFTGSYETLTGWLGIVPQGAAAAVAVTAAGRCCGRSSSARSRSPRTGGRSGLAGGRGGARTRGPGGGRSTTAAAASTRARSSSPRCRDRDPALRHRVVAAAPVAAWLVPAWLLSRPDNSGFKLGLALAGLLAFAALTGGLSAAPGSSSRCAGRCGQSCSWRSRPGCAPPRAPRDCARRFAARCIGCGRSPPMREEAADWWRGSTAGPRAGRAGARGRRQLRPT